MKLSEAFAKALNRLRAPGSFVLTEALFLRLLGLIYLSAFASLWPQILGLVGSAGVAPAAHLLSAMRAELGSRAFLYSPSLFWVRPADNTLLVLCALGCLASLLLAAGIFARSATVACFILYLSLSSVGQPFTSFQWDSLLLEAGFLAFFAGAPWLVWAYRLLLFRLMFESGFVKLASHDPNWRNLHALRFHFMTQPLPNPLAYYAYRLPSGFLDAATAVTLFLELVAPLLLFGPRIARYIAAGLLLLLQLLILLTGNYAFFNYLTVALCLWAFDDRLFAPLRRILRFQFPQRFLLPDTPALRLCGNLCVLLLILLGILQLRDSLSAGSRGAPSQPLLFLQPFEVVNGYGLFAVMTTTRPEIVLEGSNDRVNWRAYEFRYKPGDTHRGLHWVAPYQPRLDWQMWFAALGGYNQNTWVGGLAYRLLTGEASVTRLLAPLPFSRPPRYLRALLYNYDFTTPGERAHTGAVWTRKLQGVWFGPVSLRAQ